MAILVATGTEKINKFIKDNALGKQCDVATSRRFIIDKNKENRYELIYLSSVLPGQESIKEIIFETQRESNCRIVFLVGSSKPRYITELFMLGVRDFIFDPIDPQILLSSLNKAATYSNAVENIKKLPFQPKTLLKQVIEMVQKNVPEPAPEITTDAKDLLKGLLVLLGQAEGKTLEQSLLNLEDGISLLLTQNMDITS